MTCTDCGHKLAEGTKFCSECGIVVSNTTNPVSISSKDYLTKILEYLREIIHCETALIAFNHTIQENNRIISGLCVARTLPAPPEEPEAPVEPKLNLEERIPSITRKGIVCVLAIVALFTPIAPIGGIVLAIQVFALIKDTVEAKKQYDKEILIYDRNYDEYDKAYDNFELKLEAHHQLKADEKLRMKTEAEQKKLYEEQSTRVNELITHAMGALSALYAVNILHIKYRNLTAVASIYDYISTKRTYSLERTGNDPGAYNTYEDDLRFGRIVNATVNVGAQITSAIRGLSSNIRAMNVSICNAIERASARHRELTSQVIDGINMLNKTAEDTRMTAERIRVNSEIANKDLAEIKEYNRIRTRAQRDFGGIKDKTGTFVD